MPCCSEQQCVCTLTGMPVTSVRELRVLQQCKHPNLVQLKKVVTGSKLDRYLNVCMVCTNAAVTVLTHPEAAKVSAAVHASAFHAVAWATRLQLALTCR